MAVEKRSQTALVEVSTVQCQKAPYKQFRPSTLLLSSGFSSRSTNKAKRTSRFRSALICQQTRAAVRLVRYPGRHKLRVRGLRTQGLPWLRQSYDSPFDNRYRIKNFEPIPNGKGGCEKNN